MSPELLQFCQLAIGPFGGLIISIYVIHWCFGWIDKVAKELKSIAASLAAIKEILTKGHK